MAIEVNAETGICAAGTRRLNRESRGQRIVLDDTPTAHYDVPTKRIDAPVYRNEDQFPHDFMFRLTKQDWDVLKSQFVTE